MIKMMQDLGAVQIEEDESHGRKVAVWRIAKDDFNLAGNAGKFDHTLGKKWLKNTEKDRKVDEKNYINDFHHQAA